MKVNDTPGRGFERLNEFFKVLKNRTPCVSFSWTTLYELTKLDDATFDQKLHDHAAANGAARISLPHGGYDCPLIGSFRAVAARCQGRRRRAAWRRHGD